MSTAQETVNLIIEKVVTDTTFQNLDYLQSVEFPYDELKPNFSTPIFDDPITINVTNVPSGKGGIISIIRQGSTGNAAINFNGTVINGNYPIGVGQEIIVSYLKTTTGLQFTCENGISVIQSGSINPSDSFVDIPKGYNLTKEGIVISKGGGGYKNYAAESPMVFWDYKIGKYRMCFVAYSGTGSANIASLSYATSVDLETWNEYGSSFFGGSGITGSPDEFGTTGVFVWLEKGTYHLFYIGLTGAGYEAGVKRICHATSTDFVTWTRLGAVISPNTSFTWRNTAIWHPNIIKKDGTYYMFFNADGGAGNESIGYATSTDLNTWTVDDVHSPLITKASGWESDFVGDPCVYKIDKVWYMAYFGVGTGGASEGLATTTEDLFPLGWVKYSGNPVLTTGSSYDNQYAHKPFIFLTANKYYHWYTAVGSSTGRQIALASQNRNYRAITGNYTGTMQDLYNLILSGGGGGGGNTGGVVDLVFSSNTGLINSSGVWTGVQSANYYLNYGLCDYYLPANTEGRIWFQYGNGGYDAMLAFNTTRASESFNSTPANPGGGVGNYEASLHVNSLNQTAANDNGIDKGQVGSGTINPGEYVGIYRQAGIVKAQKSTDGTTWTDVYTYDFTSNAALYINLAIYDGKMYNPKGLGLSLLP